MNVRAQPNVVRKIPAIVIGIVINYDLIGVPEPIVAEAEIVVGN